MNVKVEDAGPCRKLLYVSAPAEAVAPEYQRVVKAIAGVAETPGFRPGRAPLSVVEKRYQRSIREETRDRLVPQLYREALKQEGIVPVAVVDMSEPVLDKDRGIEFRITVDVPPEFSLPKYKKIPVPAEKVEVTELQEKTAYRRILEGFARFESVEGRSVREGDLVQVDFTGEVEGRPMREMVPDRAGIAEGHDFWVMCGGPEYIPGFAKQLEGASGGESRTLTVKFPEDYRERELAGKEATYSVRVKAVREKIMPTEDAEFFKQLGVESADALKARIRGDLESAARRETRSRQHDAIAKYLLEKTALDVPQTVVDQERDLMVQNIVRRIVSEGGTRQQVQEQRDSILSAATQTSLDRVKVSYILARIAEQEKVEVTDAEVEERIQAMAERHGMAPERLKAELEKRNSLENLRSEIRSEKTLDVLLENAKVE